MGGKVKTSFKPGHPGGPGRPPLEKSITAALRKAIDPNDIVALYREALADTELDIRLRLEVAERVTNRLEGTPIQSLRTQNDDLPQIIIAGPDDNLDEVANE